MGTQTHRENAPDVVGAAVLTVSTSRTLKDDETGALIKKALEDQGHPVRNHQVVADHAPAISEALLSMIQDAGVRAVIVNGGTGITSGDVTIEAVRPLFEKELTAFSGLFAQLSYQQVGTACLLSRATAGVIRGCLVFLIPGSPRACDLALAELILPELTHMAGHVS